MKIPLLLLLSLAYFSLGVDGYPRIKIRHWFPQYEAHWLGQAPFCHEQLHAYYTNNRTVHPAPCASAADCLLSNATGTIESNFASATVVLGLVPGILMLVSPTVAEVAALSTYRPLLAILISAGSPATSVTTLSQQVNILEPFNRPTSRLLDRWSVWMSKQSNVVRASLQALYHVIAMLAIANNVQTSVHLDLRTICGWQCGVILLPVAWSLTGILVHTPGMIAIRLPLKDGFKTSPPSLIQSMVFKKAALGATSVSSDLLLWLATFCAVIQLIFGILGLASLVFISTLEAVDVFLRYAAATLSCEAILLLELADMRRELRGHASTTKVGQSEHRVRI